MASFANSGSIPREPALVVDGVVAARPSDNKIKNSQTLDNFPAVDTFRGNEATYIVFWKNCWSGVQVEVQ
jgi:hypothetical protein